MGKYICEHCNEEFDEPIEGVAAVSDDVPPFWCPHCDEQVECLETCHENGDGV